MQPCTHHNDTHVLIDEQGIAVVSGTLEDVEEQALWLLAQGFEKWEVRVIDATPVWNWETVDWGD